MMMVLRTGRLTEEQWKKRINEFIEDITKEDDEYSIEILDLLINTAIDAKDERQDINNETED